MNIINETQRVLSGATAVVSPESAIITSDNFLAQYCDGVDDDAQINNAIVKIASLLATGERGKFKATKGTYHISHPIVAKNNIDYDFTDAKIILDSGANCAMFVDEAHYTGSGSAQNITLQGGFWDRGANAGVNNNLHSIILGGISPQIRNVRGTSTGGKYFILIQNATNFIVDGVFADTVASDGVHIQGPAANGKIRNVWGTAGDDLVALTPNDFVAYVWGNEGDITDITIENIQGIDATTNIIKVISGKQGSTVLNTKNISIRNVKGNMAVGYVGGIYIGDDTGSANTQNGQITNLNIDDVSISVPSATAPIQIKGSSTTLPIKGLRFSKIYSDSNSDNIISVTGKIEDLTIDGARWDKTAATVAFIAGNSADARVDFLRLSKINIKNSGSVGGGVCRFTSSGTTLKNVFLESIYTSNVDNIFDSLASCSLYLGKIHLEGNTKVLNVRSPAAVVIEACEGLKGTAVVSTITSTGTLEIKSYNFPIDVGNAQVVKTTGNMAYNTNAARACGVGPVGYNGAAWYNALSAATF